MDIIWIKWLKLKHISVEHVSIWVLLKQWLNSLDTKAFRLTYIILPVVGLLTIIVKRQGQQWSWILLGDYSSGRWFLDWNILLSSLFFRYLVLDRFRSISFRLLSIVEFPKFSQAETVPMAVNCVKMSSSFRHSCPPSIFWSFLKSPTCRGRE